MQLKEITNQEFNDFVNNFNIKSIYQTPEYGMVMANQGFNSIMLGLFEENIIIAATLILINRENGFKYAYAPRGFIMDYENLNLLNDFTKYIKDYLGRLKVMGIKINPPIIRNIYDFSKQTKDFNPKYDLIFNQLKDNGYYHLGYNNFFEALKPRFEAIINLNQSIYTLFKNIKKEYRTKIRSAIKNGIKTYQGNINDLNYLYEFTKKKYNRNLNYFQDCYSYYSKRDMIEIYYTKLDTKEYLTNIQRKLNYYEEVSNELSSKIMNSRKHKYVNKKINIDKYLFKYKNDLIEATKLLHNYPNGVVTSCILLIKQGKEITILMDGYDKRFKKLNSKHLLIWQIIQIYQKLGYTKFNLGGTSNLAIDSQKYFGLDEFKLGFGSKIYEYAGDFELITHKRNYNLYRNYVPLKNLIKSKLIK